MVNAGAMMDMCAMADMCAMVDASVECWMWVQVGWVRDVGQTVMVVEDMVKEEKYLSDCCTWSFKLRWSKLSFLGDYVPSAVVTQTVEV